MSKRWISTRSAAPTRSSSNDMTGQDVTAVNVNLAGTIGGTVGDAAIDSVIVNATNGGDVVDVFGSGTSVSVVGLAAQVNITNSEGANDVLTINTLGGNDSITATTLPAGVTRLVIDAGAGNDTILGSQGADTLLGGDGDDFVFGDNGNDVAFLGAGNDLFQWDPGEQRHGGRAGRHRSLVVLSARTSPRASTSWRTAVERCSPAMWLA